jgi:hypothetical protein
MPGGGPFCTPINIGTVAGSTGRGGCRPLVANGVAIGANLALESVRKLIS